MKKYVLLLLAVVAVSACSSTKSAYKSVDERDVPERYLSDFKKQHSDVTDAKWYQVDSTEYLVGFNTEMNECQMRYTRTYTGTYYVVPLEYVPTDITSYVDVNYEGYKIKEAFIADAKNVKSYQVTIRNNKKDEKKLQFDLRGNFSKVID